MNKVETTSYKLIKKIWMFESFSSAKRVDTCFERFLFMEEINKIEHSVTIALQDRLFEFDQKCGEWFYTAHGY